MVSCFFSIAVAPSIFKVLPAEWAAKYVRSFFPKYYLSLGLLSLTASFLANAIHTLMVISMCSVVLFFSYFWLTPNINEARDLGQQSKFRLLHALSVLLNFIVMCLFIWVLFADFNHG